jgi:arylsulfatase A-like enzyme
VDYGFDHFEHDTFHDDAGIPAAAEYLAKRNKSKPLCLLAGSNWPHVPWPKEAPEFDPGKLTLPATSVDTRATRAWRARYAAAVSKADAEMGVVMEAARANLGENTIYLWSADHGAQWPFGKWNCYEAGIRAPLIVAWKGQIKAGSSSAAMVTWVDLLPTLVEAAGGEPPAGIDGRSFLPVLLGKAEQHRDRIFATHSGDGNWNIYPIRSVREGQWKYIRNLHPEFAFTTHIDLPAELGQRAYFKTWEAAATRDERAAAMVRRYHERPAEELYDLSADPDEVHNLAAAQDGPAEKLAHLRGVLDEWLRDQGDTLKVYGRERLLSDPKSYGPDAVPRAPAPAPAK